MAALAGLWHKRNCSWVNPPHGASRAANRLWQLRLAQSVGLRIPDTVVTNDPDEAQRFIAEHRAGVILKDLDTPFAVIRSRPLVSFTRTINALDHDRLQAVALAPCLFQERIPKHHEVRAYVIGDRILAAGVASAEDDRTLEDYRRRRYQVKIWPYTLSSDVVERCQELVAATGLKYAGIDLIVTPDGDTVFLELGPYSSWVWVQEQGGIPLTSAFTDLLTTLTDNDG